MAASGVFHVLVPRPIEEANSFILSVKTKGSVVSFTLGSTTSVWQMRGRFEVLPGRPRRRDTKFPLRWVRAEMTTSAQGKPASRGVAHVASATAGGSADGVGGVFDLVAA